MRMIAPIVLQQAAKVAAKLGGSELLVPYSIAIDQTNLRPSVQPYTIRVNGARYVLVGAQADAVGKNAGSPNYGDLGVHIGIPETVEAAERLRDEVLAVDDTAGDFSSGWGFSTHLTLVTVQPVVFHPQLHTQRLTNPIPLFAVFSANNLRIGTSPSAFDTCCNCRCRTSLCRACTPTAMHAAWPCPRRRFSCAAA